jgi:hypothetical protein
MSRLNTVTGGGISGRGLISNILHTLTFAIAINGRRISCGRFLIGPLSNNIWLFLNPVEP